MKQQTYKTQIVPIAGSFESELYLYRQEGETIFNTYIKNGELVEEKVNKGEASNHTPFLRAPEQVLRAVIEALEAIRKPLGVPEPTKEYTQGKLEATEAHLEDMRAILFGGKVEYATRPQIKTHGKEA